MKTPWRFFAELTGRRRGEDTEKHPDHENAGDSSNLDQALPAALPAVAEQAVLGPSVAADPVQSTEHASETPGTADPIADTGDKPVSDGGTMASDDVLEIVETLPKNAKQSGSMRRQSSAKTKRRVSRQEQGHALETLVEIAPLDQAPSLPQPPGVETFHAQVSALDDDIRHLKRQLAEKLREQNQQLKTMLARFDRL